MKRFLIAACSLAATMMAWTGMVYLIGFFAGFTWQVIQTGFRHGGLL